MIPGGPGCQLMFCATAPHGGGAIPFMQGIAALGIGGGIRGLGVICASNRLKLAVLRVIVDVVVSDLAASGGGPSPSSAISDMYSSSILALSPWAGGPPWPGRFWRQSRAMWPAAPQLEQTMLLVTLGLSGHCKI
jgi:hypothetical protein